MKSSTKILIALLFPLVICQVALAWSDTDNASNHSVVALKNCEVVSNQTMTAEQFEAYLGLKQQEQEIHRLKCQFRRLKKR